MSHENDNRITLIAIYVDDILIATNNNARLCEIKRELSCEFEMKDLGKVKHCLGMEFARDEKF